MVSSLAFLLLAIPQQSSPDLLAPAESTRRTEPTRLLLKTHSWDTSAGQPFLFDSLRFSAGDADQAGYYFGKYGLVSCARRLAGCWADRAGILKAAVKERVAVASTL